MLASSHPTTAARLRAHGLAWLLALLLPLTLFAGLALARTALAAAAPAPLDPGPFPTFADAEGEEECAAEEPGCEEELDFEECEEWEDEEGECEEAPGGKVDDRARDEAPAECLLTSARPRVSISASQRRLRLDVRYDLSGPAEVSISLRSSGGKGAVATPARRLRLAHDGSFHDSAALSEEETERALGAKQFTVRMRVLDVPWSCHRYDFRHLVVKRGGNDAPVFSESGADLRAGR